MPTVLLTLAILAAASAFSVTGAQAPRVDTRVRIVPAMEASTEEAIKVGAAIPDVEVTLMDEDGARCSIKSVLGNGKALLLGMPGAFTPTCTDQHMPGYFRAADQLSQLGVSTVAVVTTNDRWTNAKWQESLEECIGKASPVKILSDPRGDLSDALGLMGYLGRDLGIRAKRFAIVVEGGLCKHIAIDSGSIDLNSTSAESMIEVIQGLMRKDDGEQSSQLAVAGLGAAALAAALFYGGESSPTAMQRAEMKPTEPAAIVRPRPIEKVKHERVQSNGADDKLARAARPERKAASATRPKMDGKDGKPKTKASSSGYQELL